MKIRGQTLIELILALGLSAIFLPALITGLLAARQGKPQQTQRVAAVALLKEAVEATRNVREKGWVAFAVNGTYHPVVVGSNWSLLANPEVINGFTRSVVIQDTLRDSSGKIVTSSGTNDLSTKNVIFTVSWTTPYPSSISQSLYFTRYLDNLAYVETTQTDFNKGTKSGVVVKASAANPTPTPDDGEVVLAAGGGGGDWCIPSLSITTADLSRQGVPTAISAIQGSIVTGTGANASGPTFAQITVSGNNPPQTAITGTFDGFKANGVFRDTDIYGYLATTDHSEEVKILDLNQYSDPPTNSKFKKVGYFNSPGNVDGKSIFVLGNIGYMTTDSNDNKFYTFDLTSRIGSRPRLGSYTLSLAGTGNKVTVVNINGNIFAFVATNSTTTQMQVINVTNPSNPSIVAKVQTNNNQPGIDVSVNPSGTRAYLVTSLASGNKDFFIIDTTTLSGGINLPIVGSYDTSSVAGTMTPKGVAVATGNRAIIVGSEGTFQYLTINITNESNPVLCTTSNGNATLAIPNGAFAVSTVLQTDGFAYSYVVTGDTHAELKIILGGNGGQFSSSGTFTSQTIDFSKNILNPPKIAFNRFDTNVATSSAATISFQIAIANSSGGSCSGAAFTYIGPGGTGSPTDTFNGGGVIPLMTSGNYNNPGNCIAYKAIFNSTDSTQSPVFKDITINYSP